MKYNVLAIIGFILSFIFPIVGLILCLIALGQIRGSGESGHGLAVAGIIISIISMVASFVIIPIYLVWI